MPEPLCLRARRSQKVSPCLGAAQAGAPSCHTTLRLRLCPKITVCLLLKSSTNATRGRLDNFGAGAEQRHRFRLLELLDFVRGRCRRSRDDFGLPELRQAHDRAEDVNRSGRRKCGENFGAPASAEGKRITAHLDDRLHQPTEHPASSLATAAQEPERTPG